MAPEVIACTFSGTNARAGGKAERERERERDAHTPKARAHTHSHTNTGTHTHATIITAFLLLPEQVRISRTCSMTSGVTCGAWASLRLSWPRVSLHLQTTTQCALRSSFLATLPQPSRKKRSGEASRLPSLIGTQIAVVSLCLIGCCPPCTWSRCVFASVRFFCCCCWENCSLTAARHSSAAAVVGCVPAAFFRSGDYVDFVSKCLVKDFEKRSTTKKILEVQCAMWRVIL